MIALNLKVYRESTGARALELARIAVEVEKETGVPIVVAPALVDIGALSVELPQLRLYAQHVDVNECGAFTGTVPLETLRGRGVRGTLLNHAERKVTLHHIATIVRKARTSDFETMVCTVDAEESAAVASLRPTWIAVEPPELIGSGVSVSTAKPEVITSTIERVRAVAPVPVLCGAGISNAHDVKRALELGAAGVLLASAYVKAKDPRALLSEMARQF